MQKIFYLKYFLIAICLTSSLMLLKKRVLNDGLIILRNLAPTKEENYVCNKAGSRLTDKYTKGFSEKRKESCKLSKAQQSIIDFARDSSYSNIKPYIKRLGIFIAFIFLDIILIFVWISYCSCCCCSCCLFKNIKHYKAFSFFSCAISAFCNLLVIIFSIVVLSTVNPFFKRVNGLGCSAFKFLDHIRYGLSPSYPLYEKDWVGIEGIKYKLNYAEYEKNNIFNEKENLNTKGVGDECRNNFGVDKDEEAINDLFESSFDINFEEQISDLDEATKSLDDAEKDVEDNIYDTLHDYINKHAKKSILAVFSLTLVFGVLGLANLILYFIFKFDFLRIIYVVIWNISMLLMLLAILLSAIFGILGYILKDGVAVGQYIISPTNLNSNDPLVFSSNDGYVSDLIDICANGNGSFTNIIQESGALTENIERYQRNISSYEEKLNILKSSDICNDSEKINLTDYYNGLIRLSNRAINITNNLTDVKCNFAKNDKNIILNEIESGGKKAIIITACGFLVGAFLGLSVLFGIALVHRYRLDNIIEPKKNVELNLNDSTQNVGGNETTINNVGNNVDVYNK